MNTQVIEYTEDGKKLCLGNDCPHKQECDGKIWSMSRFFIGIIKDLKVLLLSPEVWVFIIASVLFVRFADKKILGQWISYFSLCGAFMFFKPLSSLIAHGNLNVNASVGATVNKTVGK